MAPSRMLAVGVIGHNTPSNADYSNGFSEEGGRKMFVRACRS
jgi:hypothetical protein